MPNPAPGHVLVVVIPDLSNKNAIDPLQPRADSNTLDAIQQFLQARNSLQVEYHLANPRYQQVQLSFTVQFKPGYELMLRGLELLQFSKSLPNSLDI